MKNIIKNKIQIKNNKKIYDSKKGVGGKMASKTKIYISNRLCFISQCNFCFILFSTTPSKNWSTKCTEFYHLWPLEQWISSLVGLILLYWLTGYYYNRWLSQRGGWLDWKTRIWLIILDLFINLSFGLYYIDHRETVLGSILLKCPIAISPLIFILELIFVYMYYRYGKNSTKK